MCRLERERERRESRKGRREGRREGGRRDRRKKNKTGREGGYIKKNFSHLTINVVYSIPFPDISH